MTKKILLPLLGLLPLFASAQKNMVDEIIWVVGDEPILLSDVEEQRINADMRGISIDNPYCTIPEQMAIQKLFLHQAELDSITVSESDIISSVDNRINSYIQAYGSREAVEQEAHMKISQMREMYKKQAREEQMVQQVQQKLTSSVTATPAEVRDYFQKLPQDSLPFIPTQVEVQIITSVPQVSRTEVERIEGRLREFARRVNSGESEFSTLAKLYSEDGSARNGGELGYSGRNQWVPEFANVAFSLNDPKKVSKIVRTEFGFHILQLIDKRGDKVNVRHILLKPQIEESEFQRNIARLDSIANDIRAHKFSFEEAAAALSDDKDTRNNHGLMSFNGEDGRTSRFQMKDLPTEVAREVENMEVGDVSNAFSMINEKGKTVVAIVKLKSRTPAHRATITEDFQVMKNVVLAKQRADFLHQWVVNKIKTTYVRMNDRCKKCKFEYEGWVK